MDTNDNKNSKSDFVRRFGMSKRDAAQSLRKEAPYCASCNEKLLRALAASLEHGGTL